MTRHIFATKLGMDQTWTKHGKRLAVTRCRVEPNLVVARHNPSQKPSLLLRSSHAPQTQPKMEIGYGRKKLGSMSKPLRTKLTQSGFSQGVRQLRGVPVSDEEISQDGADTTADTGQTDQSTQLKPGDRVTAEQVLSVGDVVKIQANSKGRGFTGAMKRHGFHGGPATHGQSDRERAVGSIGAGTTPGKVWKGKKMPGRHGGTKRTVTGLVVVRLDPETQEVWLSGPIPGHPNATLRIIKTGQTKHLELIDTPEKTDTPYKTDTPEETKAADTTEAPSQQPAQQS